MFLDISYFPSIDGSLALNLTVILVKVCFFSFHFVT